mmetsp:Transcript_21046/g.43713  ORF Transcript_21046/g.43713 Transcript_21046/m.43713 type:complete len:217 (+) Transcript_21046:1563-2213(+)
MPSNFQGHGQSVLGGFLVGPASVRGFVADQYFLGQDGVQFDAVLGQASVQGSREDLGRDAPDGGLVFLSQKVAGASSCVWMGMHGGASTLDSSEELFSDLPFDQVSMAISCRGRPTSAGIGTGHGIVEIQQERHLRHGLLAVSQPHDPEIERPVGEARLVHRNALGGPSRGNAQGVSRLVGRERQSGGGLVRSSSSFGGLCLQEAPSFVGVALGAV